MSGRIYRQDDKVSVLSLPEVGRLHIGERRVSKNGSEYPAAVDYFIPAGKYAELFSQAVGDKPQTIQIIFPDDNPEIVCDERYEYRDNSGALVAYGDGKIFRVWNGQKYLPFSVGEYPDIMERISAKNPTKRGADNWDIVLRLRFIIPAVRGVVGVWYFCTKGSASSVKNIRDSFDGVQLMRGTVTQTVFDLSVKFHKSNKPGDNSRYPVVSLVANDNRIEDIRKAIKPADGLHLLSAK